MQDRHLCEAPMRLHSSSMRSLLVVIALGTLIRAQTFRSTVDHVAVPVTVQSERNESATDLRPEDFTFFCCLIPAEV